MFTVGARVCIDRTIRIYTTPTRTVPRTSSTYLKGPMNVLTKSDIDWIKSKRKHTTKNRESKIKNNGDKVNRKDEITSKELIERLEKVTKGIVNEINTENKNDYVLEEGVIFEKGDVRLVIDLDDMKGVHKNEVKHVNYDDEEYRVVAANYLGLGEINRAAFLIRKVN